MLKTIAFVLAGIAAGLAIATWWGGSARAPSSASESLPIADRLAALETALAAEERRSSALEHQVASLEQRLAAFSSGVGGGASAPTSAPRGADVPAEAAVAEEPPAVLRTFRTGPNRIRDDGELIERFIAAGIRADRAQWIVQRTEELRMEALQAQYDAARGGAPLMRARPSSGHQCLRAELGDADYERYCRRSSGRRRPRA
jgi:hypothetical protein